jgi:hypothetical protein
MLLRGHGRGRRAQHRPGGRPGAGGYREELTQIADARRAWNAATEASRQRALMADTELRRRQPHAELPSLRSPEEARGSGTAPKTVDPDVEARQSEPGEPAHQVANVEAGPEPEFGARRTDAARLDIKAALEAARRAQDIVAERAGQPDCEAEQENDDVMRRREAEARQEADACRSAVRQDPAASRHLESLEREELELEA